VRTNAPGGIHVVALTASGKPLTLGRLGHGQHPEALLHEHGLVADRPVRAEIGTTGALELTYAVTGLCGIRPEHEAPRRDPDVPADVAGDPYQRVAAYALVTSRLGLLLTEFTALTNVAGQWGLPGGGLDPGESPVDGVLREVWEETGQEIALGPLVQVQSSAWVGRSPSGPVEDFHAIRIVYRAQCPDPTEPVIHDVGGTTGDARWVPLDRLDVMPLTRTWAGVETLVRAGSDAT
jgi:8-oxo-dGTP pyrophosphatase MutT (NUDIX family)